MTTKHVTVAQVQTPSKQAPTRAKEDQARAVNLQINIRRRPTAPLKMQKQTIQTTFSNNGGKSRRKKNASGVFATNAQEKVITPEALLQGRRGRHWRYTMANTTAGAWCTATTGTANMATANTTLGTQGKKRRNKRQDSR